MKYPGARQLPAWSQLTAGMVVHWAAAAARQQLVLWSTPVAVKLASIAPPLGQNYLVVTSRTIRVVLHIHVHRNTLTSNNLLEFYHSI